MLPAWATPPSRPALASCEALLVTPCHVLPSAPLCRLWALPLARVALVILPVQRQAGVSRVHCMGSARLANSHACLHHSVPSLGCTAQAGLRGTAQACRRACLPATRD